MGIKFMVDSGSDLLPTEAEELGVIHIPLTVRFGNDECRDAVDLTHSQFYEKLIESDMLPATSQVAPATFEEEFAKATADGDSVICITISSKLSGTYRSACLAARSFPDKVFVIDSESVCVGEQILLRRALELYRDGMDIGEIVDCLNIEKRQIRLLALLDTLEYLKKGGRISSGVAFAGSILGIKPVITVSNGEVALIGKARGSKQGNNLLRELVSKGGGIDFSKPFAMAYSGMSDKLLQKYITDSSELWQGKVDLLPIYTVGCVIGTHAGPGAIAVAFFEDKSE